MMSVSSPQSRQSRMKMRGNVLYSERNSVFQTLTFSCRLLGRDYTQMLCSIAQIGLILQFECEIDKYYYQLYFFYLKMTLIWSQDLSPPFLTLLTSVRDDCRQTHSQAYTLFYGTCDCILLQEFAIWKVFYFLIVKIMNVGIRLKRCLYFFVYIMFQSFASRTKWQKFQYYMYIL